MAQNEATFSGPAPFPASSEDTPNQIPRAWDEYYPEHVSDPVLDEWPLRRLPEKDVMESRETSHSAITETGPGLSIGEGRQNALPQAFDTTGQVPPPGMNPHVTAALWEDEKTLCFQVEAKGICVGRREDNLFINATQLLNVASMTRRRRERILKGEKMRRVVEFGPSYVKGVWIPFERALDLANLEKITEILYPLFVHNIGTFLTPQTSTDSIMGLRNEWSSCTWDSDLASQRVQPLSIDTGLSNARSMSTTPVSIPPSSPTQIKDEIAAYYRNKSASRRDTWKQKLARFGPPVGPHPDARQNLKDMSCSPQRKPSLKSEEPEENPEVQSIQHAGGGKDHFTDLKSDADQVNVNAECWNKQLTMHSVSYNISASNRSTSENSLTTADSLEEMSSTEELRSPCPSTVYSPRSPIREATTTQMSLKKRELVRRLMAEFYSMFYPESGLITHGRPNSSATQQNTETYLSANGQSSGNGGRKRKASDEDSPLRENNGDENSNKRPRPSLSNPDDDSDTPKKFACPYFKRNPRKYQRFRSCPGPGWDTVHRVKEHLYRRHALPIRCPRCYQSFKNDVALRDHQRSIQPCEVREEEPIEGFDKDQEKKLKSRKRSCPEQSEEDKWREVFRILFPDDEPSIMPSPYYDYDLPFDQDEKSPRSAGFARYEEFLSRELPRMVQKELELAMERELEPIEAKLRSQLVDIVRTCQEKAFRLYRGSAQFPNGPLPTIFETENLDSDPTASGSTPAQSLTNRCANVEAEQHLSPFVPPPPLPPFDTWPEMNQIDPMAGFAYHEHSDSGYDSLDWTLRPFSRPPQNHGDSSRDGDEVWNSLDIALCGVPFSRAEDSTGLPGRRGEDDQSRYDPENPGSIQ